MADSRSSTTATAPTVAAIGIPEGGEGRAVSVEWGTGERTSFNVLWLRDNCPSGGDKRSAFRSFSVAELDPSLTITAASSTGAVTIDFSDGHRSTFDPVWLHAHRPGAVAVNPLSTWRADGDLPTLDMAEVRTDAGWHALLEAISVHGAAIVADVPPTNEGSSELASKLGHVRETDFGRFFDIISEPAVWTMSQSTAAMDPHTDDPYRYTPSGISILHCFESSPTGGGRSTLVDGFAVVIEFTKRIRNTDFQWEHGLRPGEAIVFDNQRVLHGRTAFDGDPGRRHLQLCTVDREQVHSTLRLLREQHATGTEHQKLPVGNLS